MISWISVQQTETIRWSNPVSLLQKIHLYTVNLKNIFLGHNSLTQDAVISFQAEIKHLYSHCSSPFVIQISGTKSLWEDSSILFHHHLPHHLILFLLLLLSSFFLPPPLFCLCLKHLCQLCLALLLSSSFSHSAWLESFHLHLHPAPLNLLACPEGSLLLTQCTISLQTTDTGCKYIYTDSA